jgi:hypothetical protein
VNESPAPEPGEAYAQDGQITYTTEASGDEVYFQADGNDLVAITDIDADGWGIITVFTSSDPNATVARQGRINVRQRRNMDPTG